MRKFVQVTGQHITWIDRDGFAAAHTLAKAAAFKFRQEHLEHGPGSSLANAAHTLRDKYSTHNEVQNFGRLLAHRCI